jgi:hypothetical protein
MPALKTRSLQEIEQRMQGVDQSSLRYKVLDSVKNFKTSWIELGQALYSVWKDKLYKEWGYVNFDTYSSKELGIRKQTAMKLLKSYYFLEKEEPGYLQKDYVQSTDAVLIPQMESVNMLRLAKNKKILDEHDYHSLKKQIFEKGKEATEVRKELTSLIRQREELSPEEAREKRKLASVKRLLSVLKSLRQELEEAKLTSANILKEISALIKNIEAEIF